MPNVLLAPVDYVDLLVLVDNYVDSLLASDKVARHFARPYEYFSGPTLRAEHGFSVHVRARWADGEGAVLYDAGVGRDTPTHNLDVLGLTLSETQAIVISHGHSDHHGGLEGLALKLGRRMPVVLHPDAWRDRKLVFPSGAELHLVPPDRVSLAAAGFELVEERDRSLLIDGHVLVTGQVERTTDFETGYPGHFSHTGSAWEPDPRILDDQALVLHLREKGLVIISGCSHAGIINIVRHAQHVSGVHAVHAIIGGMHLTGGAFDGRIARTLDELVELQPAVVVPGHCTGWKAIHALSRRMPEAYVQASVGTTLHLE
jgi:7,8-dihydropterin-6-yl-methyl-4-(beta-D-ribofuranosyl)aminobenzene 5'-phosphate synthase